MPRELVHWRVCNGAITHIIESGRITLEIDRSAALIGAIAHDAPYYLLGSKDSNFQFVAEALHGSSGEDTYEPLRVLIRLLLALDCSKEQAFIRGFLLGFVSHLVTDTVFHPPIIYLTGNYYDRIPAQAELARMRHRGLESALDLAFGVMKPHMLVSPAISTHLGKFNKGSSTKLRQQLFEKLMTSCQMGQDWRLWERALHHLATLQRFFNSDIVASLMRMVQFFAPRAGELSALFKDPKRSASLNLSSRFFWRHPITGVGSENSWNEFESEAIAQTVEFFTEILSAEAAGAIPQKINEYGPSLSFNLPRITKEFDLTLSEHLKR